MIEYLLNNNVLHIRGAEDFSLERSCYCGQAFRWTDDGKIFSCVIGNKLIHVTKDKDSLCIYPCDEHSIEGIINYFDLHRDYNAIEKNMEQDEILSKCIPYAKGIRVFNQAPFETLISFIISANNNVKRISLTINNICKACGEKMITEDGEVFYTFPTPQRLSEMTVEQLRALGTGYRDSYIKQTSQAIVNGFCLEQLRDIPYCEAKKEICKLSGVGSKVADCVLLFSLGHSEAFPMDVWMKRAVSKMFFDGETPNKRQFEELMERLGKDAGKIQQYIFHYARETGLK